MTVTELLNNKAFSALNTENPDREIKSVYCCDLLSIVMGRAPADCAWVTVMGNINAVAVAVLADISVIVLAENMQMDATALNKAKAQGVNVITTELPVFDAAKLIDGDIDG